MALTPLDIQNKSFSTKIKGYNQDEVDDFLDLIVRDYEDTLAKNRELEKSLKHSKEKLEYFNELKDALNQSIIVAQDTADKVKTSANKESEVIVNSAQNKANEMIANAENRANYLVSTAEDKARLIIEDTTEQAKRLATETDDLKKKTRVFHQRLMLMLESQLEQAKSEEWDELLKPFSSFVGDGHEIIKEILSEDLDNTENSAVNSKPVINDFDEDSSETAEQSEESNVSDTIEVLPIEPGKHAIPDEG